MVLLMAYGLAAALSVLDADATDHALAVGLSVLRDERNEVRED